MKVVIQRVTGASVLINNKEISKIDNGMVVLVGFNKQDNENKISEIVKKIVNLRIFNDANGVMNLSLLNKDYSVLSVSQFTLYADTKRGNRPSYINAMNGNEAIKLYEKFNKELRRYTSKVKTGVFGENMEVSLVNDGPVTVIIEN